MFRGIRGKVAIYNENIRAIADRYDCIVADQWALKEVQDTRFFDDDRLHYNPLGHHEVARMVLRALNVPNDLQPMQPDPLPARTWREARAEDLVWARDAPRAVGAASACATSPPATTSPPSAPSRCRSSTLGAGDRMPRRRHAGGRGPGASAASQRPERDGARRGDVERVHAARHRDRDDRVGRLRARGG